MTFHCAQIALLINTLPPQYIAVLSRDLVGGLTIITFAQGAPLCLVVAAGKLLLQPRERNLIRSAWGLPPLPTEVDHLLGAPDTPVTAELLPPIIPPQLAEFRP